MKANEMRPGDILYVVETGVGTGSIDDPRGDNELTSQYIRVGTVVFVVSDAETMQDSRVFADDLVVYVPWQGIRWIRAKHLARLSRHRHNEL